MTLRCLHDALEPGRRADALMVLLPGALQRPEDLIEHGHARAVRERGLAFDIVLADPGLAHIGEAANTQAVDRLDEELLRPASRQYREVWIAGISLGGFLALAHAARYPGVTTGLCLLAPYPGTRMVTGTIARAGGLDAWMTTGEAPRGYGGEDDDECRIWRWLAGHRGQARPEMHLGYGVSDRFADGQRLMASALPEERVEAIAGDHDWPTWERLWRSFLDRRFARAANIP
ncbi:alpha/beta fold hydrolase domain-containing protein [Noviherbaspirillum pedocola]|uniref:Alpha/beta hydrolase n=1 Tax=Noviherbaspirillum pedocola TaxID=2801341 RepID=A0A934SU97_9BURK|nr:alpha/beta hydrolase [Noviherbaspirillum pedocola]MBK4736695.1 alpha/beta hydrolase [Noviherbaspirillum pedocola]